MMKFNEFDLEQAIWDDYMETGGRITTEAGLPIMPVMKRQLHLGDYGVADLVGFSKAIDLYCPRRLKITIYELKKDTINLNALSQAIRYAKSLLLWKANLADYPQIEVVLIGSRIDPVSSIAFAPDVFENIKIYTVSIKVSGLRFKEESGYRLRSGKIPDFKLSFNEYRKILTNE